IPLNRTARRMLGVLYHRNGNPERAHYHLLAVVTAFQGEGESTGSDFHKISRIYMEAILSRYQLAEVYRSMGRSGEALSQYRRAVVLTERLQLHSKIQSREQRTYLNHLHASILTGIRSLEQATDSDGLR
ncbi:MAG: hypothetical protein KDK27_16350, partial [Leptospiraceae bacterium]|nr:hypothetical protein [Leptospiraceae bacterium]